jgi:hypothetical protein
MPHRLFFGVYPQDFFNEFLRKYDSVFAAVKVLNLPKKLARVDRVCEEHATSQLQGLQQAAFFEPSNFAPDKINNALASLEAFSLLCRGSSLSNAAGLFDSALCNIKTRCGV